MLNSKLKYLLLFLLITLLCAGGVEAFYYVLENKLASDTATGDSAAKTQPGPDQNLPIAGGTQVKRDVDITAITRRNLFSSRTGTPPVNQPSTDPLEGVSPSTLAVVLMGTVTGPDEERRAIIYDKKARKQELYQIGDFIHQAAIKDILRGKVIITYNGMDEMLDISDARNVKVPKPKSRTAAIPKTTTKRVVGRPVGSSQKTAAPRPRDPRQLQSVKGRVIVKRRDTSN